MEGMKWDISDEIFNYGKQPYITYNAKGNLHIWDFEV